MTGKISDDAAADPTVVVTDAMCFAAEVGLVNKGPKGSALASYVFNKFVDTDGTLAGNSDSRFASQKAVKTYADALIAANDAMVFKGATDCSGNPNYPAADRGHTYRVSVAGKIGGASGIVVQVGDIFICLTDGTASGNQATVGAAWNIIQANIDGAVTGPASSTGGDFAFFADNTGKVLADANVARSVDGTLASNSDQNMPTEKAVKLYVDSNRAGANRIINPSGQVNQAGSGTAADATYWFDQWVQLNQSNPVTPSQLTNVENTTPFMMRTTQSNASAQRFGIMQPIESANAVDLRGQSVTLSARVRMSASTTLRFAIIDFTGTLDAPTIDVVNDWTSATFTTGNFFTTTGMNIVATGSIALTANTLANISLSGTMTGSTNNAMLVFWTDSTQAQNVTLDIGKVKFESGAVATPYVPRLLASELDLCRRYLYVLAPGVTGANAGAGGVSGTVGYFPIKWPPMFKTPTSVALSAVGDWNVNPFVSGGTQQNGTSVVFSGTNNEGTRVQLTTASTGSPSGAMAALETTNTSAKIIVKAQL